MVLQKTRNADEDEVVARIHIYLEHTLGGYETSSVEQTRRTLQNGIEACALPKLSHEEVELLSTYWHRCSKLQHEHGEDALLMSLLREWFGPGADNFFELDGFESEERAEMLRDFSHAITEKMIFPA